MASTVTSAVTSSVKALESPDAFPEASPEAKTNCQLEIRKLGFDVRLGCTEQERAVPQKIQVSVQIERKGLFEACSTDKLSDTVCYAQIAQKIELVLKHKEFNTIEYLSIQIWNSLAELCPKSSALHVKLKKLNPPISQLNRGAFFKISGRVE